MPLILKNQNLMSPLDQLQHVAVSSSQLRDHLIYKFRTFYIIPVKQPSNLELLHDYVKY